MCELINDTSFNHSLLNKGVPLIPKFLDKNTITMKDTTFDTVESKLRDVFSRLSISYDNSKSRYTYYCSAFKNQEFIYFEVNIFSTENDEYVLVFQSLYGDRFDYGNLLYSIGQILGIKIPGEIKLSYFLGTVDLSNIDQMREFLQELLDKDSPEDLKVQGLQGLAACARDFQLTDVSIIVSDIFGVGGDWETLLESVINIIQSTQTNSRLFLLAVSTLADIFEIKLSKDVRTQFKELAGETALSTLKNNSNKFTETEYYHLRREGLRLFSALREYNVITEPVEFDQTEFQNDKKALDIVIKLQQ